MMSGGALKAIVRKDMGEAMSNTMARVALIVVPMIMVLVFPILVTVLCVLLPSELGDFEPMLKLLPIQFGIDDVAKASYYYMMNYLMPTFFLLVPIMAASVASGTSFAGEKERRTLETLLFCPLTVHELFNAKVLGALALALLITACAFVGFLAVAFVGSALIYGGFVLNMGIWASILLVIVPAVSLIGITVMVLASAKARTYQEAQQYAAILVVPVMVMFLVPQIAGLFLYGAWQLLGIGLALLLIGIGLARLASARFTPEKLLK